MRPKSGNEMLCDVRTNISTSRNELSRIYISNCCLLFTIPIILRESPFNYLDNENLRGPRIRCDIEKNDKSLMSIVNAKRFSILVEDEIICTCQNFIHAFAVYLSVHYVFNLTYERSIKASLMFIQRLILDFPDNDSVPTKVLNLVSKVKKS